jgi:hypothetical protein
MLVALTVRKLKPGAWEDFKAAFIPTDDTQAPSGWKQFYAIRNTEDENEVVTFGFFDGTLEDLRGADRTEYDNRVSQADEFIDSVGTDGVFEVVEERKMN